MTFVEKLASFYIDFMNSFNEGEVSLKRYNLITEIIDDIMENHNIQEDEFMNTVSKIKNPKFEDYEDLYNRYVKQLVEVQRVIDS